MPELKQYSVLEQSNSITCCIVNKYEKLQSQDHTTAVHTLSTAMDDLSEAVDRSTTVDRYLGSQRCSALRLIGPRKKGPSASLCRMFGPMWQDPRPLDLRTNYQFVFFDSFDNCQAEGLDGLLWLPFYLTEHFYGQKSILPNFFLSL